jgi:hypothetical protein
MSFRAKRNHVGDLEDGDQERDQATSQTKNLQRCKRVEAGTTILSMNGSAVIVVKVRGDVARARVGLAVVT